MHFVDRCLSFRVIVFDFQVIQFHLNCSFTLGKTSKTFQAICVANLWDLFSCPPCENASWINMGSSFLANTKNQKLDFEIASLWCWSLLANFFVVSPSHQISLNKWQIPPSVPQESHLVPSPQKMGGFNRRISRVKGPSQTTTDSLPMALAALYSGTCSCPTQKTQNRKIAPHWLERCFFRGNWRRCLGEFLEEMTLGEAPGLDETWQLHGKSGSNESTSVLGIGCCSTAPCWKTLCKLHPFGLTYLKNCQWGV